MQLLFDFLPIIAFFICFKFYGIYVATAAAMVISVLLVLFHWIKHRHVPGMLLVNLAIIVILGGSTLFLHNEMFIKWKPTALNWILALAFLGSQLIGKKPLVQRMMEAKVSLPKSIWSCLNLSWVIFFSVMGLLNIVVAYNFDTNTWVNFKLFGILGLTIVFVFIQAFYLAKHISKEKNDV